MMHRMVPTFLWYIHTEDRYLLTVYYVIHSIHMKTQNADVKISE